MTRNAESWGKPLSALLGALKMQVELGLPSIGGKDSMSGTFQHINVPPMLMAFGITTVDARRVISTDLKGAGHRIYLVRHTPLENYMPDTAQLKENFAFVSDAIASGKVLAAWSVGFGGVAEGLAKMAFGNGIGVETELAEERLYEYAYGSILVECEGTLEFPRAELVGFTVADEALTVRGERMPLDELYRANTERFATIYPDKGHNDASVMTSTPAPKRIVYPGEAVEHPVAFLPVFPGTNCDYDTAKAFRRAGAEVRMEVLCNLAGDDILRSIARMKEQIRQAHIFVLSGGFSAGDEPDGSGKFIATALRNPRIMEAIMNLLNQRDGLMLGICNGFQALIKLGLVPYGEIRTIREDDPTLTYNTIGRHAATHVRTVVSSVKSPWMAGVNVGDVHQVAISHGEGRFVCREAQLKQLVANGQIVTQYCTIDGVPAVKMPENPNGSYWAVEGICSPDGRVLGKMGHSERIGANVARNIPGEKDQKIFESGVAYFG